MRFFLAVAMLAVFAGIDDTVAATDSKIARCTGPVRATGCAEYRFFRLKLYRAELHTDTAVPPGENFALSLQYHRSFTRDELVSTSLSEMARISGRPMESFEATRAQLEKTMRSVTKGDSFMACRQGPGRLELFHNGNKVGALTQDADLFLDIWLGSKSRKPQQRDRLLSGRCDD